MGSRKIVRDYYRASQESKSAFCAVNDHSFLVLIKGKLDRNNEKTSDFFTTELTEEELADLKEIAQGRMLNPDASVFPLQKRAGVGGGAGVITVGRASDRDIVIPSSSVSKLHFYISKKPFSEDEYLIADSSSTNGTKINGDPIIAHKRSEIRSGDSIELGYGFVLRFFTPSGFWEILQMSPTRFLNAIS